MERTNQATNKCLDRNLSPSTYRWKDEPSHQQVPWSKFKTSYLRVGGRTKPLTSALVQNLSPSTYGWKDKLSHSRVLWLKIKVLLPTGGRTNQATSKCLGTKFKFFYLRVEGRTKSLTGALVQNLSPSTYGWKDELSHLRVPWSKIKVLLPTSGRTNQATSKCLSTKFKSFYLRVEGRTKSQVSWSKFKSFYLRVEGQTKSLTSVLVEI